MIFSVNAPQELQNDLIMTILQMWKLTPLCKQEATNPAT